MFFSCFYFYFFVFQVICRFSFFPLLISLLVGLFVLLIFLFCAVDAGPLLTVKEQHRGIVNCLELLDGIIFCTHKGKKIRLWDAKSGKRLHTLAGHDHLVHCFGVNGHYLASGSKDKTIKIWDRRQTYAPLITLDTHKSSVRALALDKWKLVSGSKSGQGSLTKKKKKKKKKKNPTDQLFVLVFDFGQVTLLTSFGAVSIHNLNDLSRPPASINNYDCVYSIAVDDSKALVGSSLLKLYDFANAPKSMLSSCSVS